jgi:hypothetical protein
MTQELNHRCIQLDEVVDPETYLDLILEGHLPPQGETPADSGEAPAEG